MGRRPDNHPFHVNENIARFADVLRRVAALAMAPPLVYCAGLLYFFEGRLPWPGPWLIAVGLAGAGAGLVASSFLNRGAWSGLSRSTELVVRYILALLLFQYALNKLIPGQFLLYNRDLDLPVRDLPARRLAWHFLGYSPLYNGFIASVELAAGVLLCSRRTAAGGALLSLASLANIVVVDTAFGIRGALPIATVMACAALTLVIAHVDFRTLHSLVWGRDEIVPARIGSRFSRMLWLATLTLVLGFPLYMNLGARRGLGGQVAPAGRWEVIDCQPHPGLAICQSPGATGAAVIYIEIGQWGQVVTGGERRNLSFSYDKVRRFLQVRIARSDSAREGELVLDGIVDERDTIVTLEGHGPGVQPFQVRLKRTRPAPWPPVRAF